MHLEPHLTDDELHDRYRCARDPVERSHWHFLWLLASGTTATDVAAVTGYSAHWIGRIARSYNTDGPDDIVDRRHAIGTTHPDLPAAQLMELEATLAGPHPEGDRWCGRTVAQWLATRLGREAGCQLKALDPLVTDWNERDLSARRYPFVLMDALVVKVRENGRVWAMSALVATGVNEQGYREILGLRVGDSESERAGWRFSSGSWGVSSPGSIWWSLTTTADW